MRHWAISPVQAGGPLVAIGGSLGIARYNSKFMRQRTALRNALEYSLAILVVKSLEWAPLSVAHALARGYASLLDRAIPRLRRVGQRNLTMALPALSPEDITGAFRAMTREHVDALIVTPSPMLFGEYPRIASMAASNRLPAMGAAREFADFGGLMSYGANQPGVARQAATYVDKILKGAKPAELPVEQPSRYELVLNLNAAKALGLTVPPTLLTQADELIE